MLFQAFREGSRKSSRVKVSTLNLSPYYQLSVIQELSGCLSIIFMLSSLFVIMLLIIFTRSGTIENYNWIHIPLLEFINTVKILTKRRRAI